MKKYLNERNAIAVAGLIIVTIMFLQRYDINTVNELIAKINYLSNNWKDINLLEVVMIIGSYLAILGNNDFKADAIKKMLESFKNDSN